MSRVPRRYPGRKTSSLAGSANGLPPLGDDLGYMELPPEVLHSAAVTVCGHATDVADARLLLEACGLAAYQRGKFVSYAFGRTS